MGFFKRNKRSSVNTQKLGMAKALGDIAAQQHLLRNGFVSLHTHTRTEVALRPGEKAETPTVQAHFNPARSVLAFAIVVDASFHANADKRQLLESAFATAVSDDLVPAALHEKMIVEGYTPMVITFDSSKQLDDAISVEELAAVVPA